MRKVRWPGAISQPRAAPTRSVQISLSPEHVEVMRVTVVSSSLQPVHPAHWLTSRSCFGGARCKSSWQGKNDVLEGFTTENYVLHMPLLSLGSPGIRNRGCQSLAPKTAGPNGLNLCAPQRSRRSCRDHVRGSRFCWLQIRHWIWASSQSRYMSTSAPCC